MACPFVGFLAGSLAVPDISLFGTKVLLPGVGDMRTLEAVSRLAGQTDVAVRSVNTSAWWSVRPSANTTYSTRRQDRLPVDRVHSLAPGTALFIAGARPPRLASLTPWWGYPPFHEARWARSPAALAPAPVSASPPLPTQPSTRTGPTAEGEPLPVSWRRVPGARRSPDLIDRPIQATHTATTRRGVKPLSQPP